MYHSTNPFGSNFISAELQVVMLAWRARSCTSWLSLDECTWANSRFRLPNSTIAYLNALGCMIMSWLCK